MRYNSEKIDSLQVEIDELKSEREHLIYLDIINCLRENGNAIALQNTFVLADVDDYFMCKALQLRNGNLVIICVEDGELFEIKNSVSNKSLSYIHDALRKECFIY